MNPEINTTNFDQRPFIAVVESAKGTLDQTPVQFDLEKTRTKPMALRFPGKILADKAALYAQVAKKAGIQPE